MKVKDFIDQLLELDPEKNIFVLYDMYALLEPTITKVEKDSAYDKDEVEDEVPRLNNGDYYIEAF